MGEVYLAEDTRLGRKVALKILSEDFTQNEEGLRRFQQEARAASALSHQNILTIFDIGNEGSTHFIATEFIEGDTLRSKLSAPPLGIEESLEITIQVARALEAAHRSGIIHRDIKPENLMIRDDGLVKVLDFGLAKLNESKEWNQAGEEAATLILVKTTPGLIMGTVSYMSPEQARGKEVDERTDIFSLGVVMHEMLAGQLPFAGETMSDVLASILQAEPASPGSLNPRVPAELDRVTSKTLAKDREQRYQSATELLSDLRRVQRQLTQETLVKRASDIKPNRSGSVQTQDAIPTPRVGIRSLAVLPFTNAGDDPEMEYLSDGLTENILFGLSQLSEVQVLAKSAVFRHKGSEQDSITIGRTLGVGAIVTGRVRQRGKTLLISAELIDVESGWQLWGAQYKRAAENLYDIEDEIANEISQKLRLKLTPERQMALDRRRTDNNDAYHLYLKGRFHWGKRTKAALFKSLELFRQAVEADPLYALAYAGIAEGYAPLAFYCHLAPRDAAPKAKAAAEKALEIEPELPEALTVLGAMKASYDWDVTGAETLLRRAVANDPRYPRARQSLAECLTITARYAEACEEVQRALDLDPLSLHVNAAVVMDYYFARLYDEAINHAQKALELDPTFFPTRFVTGLAYQASGRLPEAVAEFQEARALSDGSTLMTAALAGALAASEKKDEANALLLQLEEIALSRYVSQSAVAAAYVGQRDVDEALSRLERAFKDRCFWLPYALTSDARFDELRGESRFQDLVERFALGIT
jgi:serine/threonine protein kinase/tetratricopeptide (TPR) repeat protein